MAARDAGDKQVVTRVLADGQVWVDLGTQTPVRSLGKAEGAMASRAPPLPGSGPGGQSMSALRWAAREEHPEGALPRNPNPELQQIREDLARFKSQGRSALRALSANLESLEEDQSRAWQLSQELEEVFVQRKLI
mmetsp:Transcript_3453/g.6070  ORF Transcript_3453/g.6070 Transcript_3453/m.6070 type:complete len:135 (-) Transcript_3453:86-490(-)